METQLQLDNGILPPWTGRRCTQKIMALEGQDPRRTVNGELIDLNLRNNQKLRTHITGCDHDAPFFDSLCKGQGMSVFSIAGLFLWCPSGQERLILNRLPVPDSVTAMTRERRLTRMFKVEGSAVTFTHPHRGLWVRYRPILHTRVMDFSLERDERTFQTAWALLLEEV